MKINPLYGLMYEKITTHKYYLNGTYYGKEKPENWDELVKRVKAERLLDV